MNPDAPQSSPHRRRVRYSGKYPRRFEEKYKEHAPAQHVETVSKVIASGKTPAGSHRPIMVREILGALDPQPGEIVLDCTLGYGGHAEAILPLLQPGGRLIGLDADPLELPKTEARLRGLGFGTESFTAIRTNFAGVSTALKGAGVGRVDCVLADLGVSSMQLDNPARGFSYKHQGPLDLRMNPQRGFSASDWLKKADAEKVANALRDFADEPRAAKLAHGLAGQALPTTLDLANAVRTGLPGLTRDEQSLAIRRAFQALRIVVNEELVALEQLLRQLPDCLNSGARVAFLTFHSGEDRRVKHAFAAGARSGIYSLPSPEVIRPSPVEQRENPRSSPAKLRFARRLLY